MTTKVIRSLRFRIGGDHWSPLKEYNIKRYLLDKDVWVTEDNGLFTYTITDVLIGPNTLVEIFTAADATEDECYSMKSASLHTKQQSHNTIIIEATKKPDIDIPIQLVISLEPTKYPIIFGVKKSSQTPTSGWSLDWCDVDGDTITLTEKDFDNHLAYNSNGYGSGFAKYTDTNRNIFCTIPIAYWWRGYIDDNLVILVSDKEGTFGGKTFSPHKAVFQKRDTLVDKIYYSKYRGTYNSSTDKMTSVATNKDGTVSMTYDNYRLACLNNGMASYSMGSYQDYIEIALREVIEKKTFDIQPVSSNSDEESCTYRGIERWMYNGTSNAEYLDGVNIINDQLYVFDDTGVRTYSATSKTIPVGYPNKILSSSLLDYLLLPESISTIDSAIVAENVNTNPSGSHGLLVSNQSTPFSAANLNSTAIIDMSKISGRLIFR